MGVVVDDVWSMLFASINANTIYVNKQFPDSKKNLKIFKDLRERLPLWLREMVEQREDKDYFVSLLIVKTILKIISNARIKELAGL